MAGILNQIMEASAAAIKGGKELAEKRAQEIAEQGIKPSDKEALATKATAQMADEREVNFNDYLSPNLGEIEREEMGIKGFEAMQEAEGIESSAEAQAPQSFTGIKTLDDKIRNGTTNALDAYYARNYLGIDLNVTLNGNLNHKVNKTDINRITSEIFDRLKTLEIGDKLIDSAQENSGTWNGLKVWLNHKTGGFSTLSHDLAQRDNLNTMYAYGMARASTNGKTSVEAIKDAKRLNDFAFKNASENTSRIAENQDVVLTQLKKNVAEAEALGVSVPQSVLDKIDEMERKIEYINQKEGKINRDEYKNIQGKYSEFWSKRHTQAQNDIKDRNRHGEEITKVRSKDAR